MKAFRNTGIEGGYGSLATQNWLLSLRRQQLAYARVTGEKVSQRHKTSRSRVTETKQLPIKGILARYVPPLLAYVDGPCVPTKHGTTSINRGLLDLGLIRCVRQPTEITKYGQYIGDGYLPTQLGRDYVEALRSSRTK